MECNVLIAGEAGQGAFSVELELTETLSRLNYNFFATKNYMSRVRGGHNFHMVRIAEGPVHALRGGQWDVVVALDSETERRHRPDLREDGIYLSQEMTREIAAVAKEAFGQIAASNGVLVGLILAVIGVTPERMDAAAGAGRGALLRKGFEFAERWALVGKIPLAARAGAHLKFDGNQALALGAILGGCQFVAGYPMTPATSILHYFSAAAPGLPVHFEQAEDEIAAINMALGASYAGVRAMVATSGGGFALMQETVSLAGMTETPIVVALSQRPGPATGLPTRTEQGDLGFVLHAGHGEFPRVVFAPGGIGEMIALTRRAFEIADRFQIPVFVLTDQYFADSVQVHEETIPLEVSRRAYPEFDGTYKRYRLTEDGISPLTYPGLSDALVKLDSDEHDEEGKITEERSMRIRMMDKRLSKRGLIEKEAVMPTFFGDRSAGTVLFSWGSTKEIVREAAERLTDEGNPTAVLHFGQVFPLTPGMVAPYGLERKRLVSVENNAAGSFAALLKAELGLAVGHRILKYDGDCFTVEEVLSRLKTLSAGKE
ncbi:MAG: 2-oxoacid:acceptor oxidoreductase subunit alpha [Deltaproteobacteria bacterium]|nr:2-oxoacid:acceptor oxidoreductase subunit alpha [Deltaproteobacteria bacterium]